ncbi:NAD(P)H-nitrite reductase large subunit [Nocardioides luteus]|uniref:FAD/NAD(P)-binding oxidoreductase n=1 Tax=Nocardioides luteus TaxID=1844 RepID=A0ABQ5SYP4_9ACTN|nr:FAD-dependent oxidoreductase [Nocardioides luteus]MDR7312672.1 NAD(P)H-nitrite reductase large subunit [Nocardioides luteus]GGR46744.1 FAD/NAD(P)-binding oxidoreductase [Nocardioides luteus]GLJ68921.1 FAD/NAD(P)-binding oxidoreductase [Nocardioides luteus]
MSSEATAGDVLSQSAPPQKRIVIIGGGMAAARLVEGLVARGLGSQTTVLAEEPHVPYNRILLSAVLEGTHRPGALALREKQWYADRGVDLRLGSLVVDIHRDTKTVELADRTRVPYDAVVLATGAIPTLPPIRGVVRMDGSMDPRVQAFRSLDDCARLLDTLHDHPHGKPRSAVIVGGGLLGLQVSRALAVRGIETEIVEGRDHLLSSQVDASAGKVLKRSMAKLGTQVYLGARATRLTDEGLRLDNGYTLETDLVVLTAGGRPRANLARRAELTVNRGIVVDDQLRSVDDPDVYAIGDCAEHNATTTGFVSPAWEQAGVLAEVLAGNEAAYEGHRVVARLRATDLDVCVLGEPQHESGEVVEIANPIKGTHRKLVVRDGRIVAGALVGDLSRVGLITQAFDRQTVLGEHEAGKLLLPEPSAAGSGVPTLPDDAEICACAGVSAGRIRACTSLEDVRDSTRATTGCGGCAPTVRQLLATRPNSTQQPSDTKLSLEGTTS